MLRRPALRAGNAQALADHSPSFLGEILRRRDAQAIEAFKHVEKIAPQEPDAFYFEGFLNAQLQHYDQAIAAFQKALALALYHASAQFGLARAYQRKGDADSAREAMKRFQKITTEHLGTPFGAGSGGQVSY